MDLAVLGRMRCWWAVLVLGLLRSVVRAQITVSPSNASTATPDPSEGGELALSNTQGGQIADVFVLVGLTQHAIHFHPTNPLQGRVFLANASSQLGIALISCDPQDYNGLIDAVSLLTDTIGNNPTSIVLYSTRENSCSAEGLAADLPAFTMNSRSDTEVLLGMVNGASYGAIAERGAHTRQVPGNGTSQNSDSNNNNASNPLGPAPSTAVAMIILYSITGIITALFLVIIFTGAVRAHRHPERYGPRNVLGRPRQSRARGLARAMLETIPIVKFGDREGEQNNKQRDVELAEGHGTVEVLPDQNSEQALSEHPKDETIENATGPGERSTPSTPDEQEGGIAAASTSEHSFTTPETQGCSICTEDFEVGQDQRVLPCDHRFHPACIDPWLLNVSGTCPLCRIDLHPQETNRSADDVDENGNPVQRDAETGLAPPLETDLSRRMSTRRSILAGLLGTRPERMTREERVNALRQYREQNATAQQSEAPPEEENSMRRRLRNAFRIRTRRTGADGQVSDVSEQ